ncbi:MULTISPECIES: Hsp33 family molecular chaperone HslO [unclassified Lactobacillus]|uniref:Hsp33 family molecular chaperone HslO n=1 Tax=unclassified Lactobacillus TaxID=2620435 RepID=UPI00226A90F9|nr:MULTISPECIES: Hsp33 family molecular chaperone HslO [unclassified Lactobacillus]MCX8720555.1 Hsp33 family molecular chaperone HslO [Lactobacillus sp. B4010]MCX8731422.1 Hsp33 family molecular chaperone HslO [Lactobacillus sp. B4015]MCX8733643.1 Hsp33 family molecular chaperone HslO [Lactobacillus sp. B4012]
MSDYLIKAIDKTKNLRLLTINAKNLVQEAQTRHDTWSASSAVLGRTLVAGVLLAGAELTDQEELTVRLLGNGPVGPTIVTAKSDLTVKGYVKNPHIALPPKDDGHIDVKKAVGEGWLEVTKDLGLKEPYTGQVPIVSGEIAEDVAYYLTKSEQIPSAVGLSVFVNPNNSIGAAGGFMLQALPGASDSLIDHTIERINNLPALSSSFLDGMTPEELAKLILGDDCKILAKDDVAFKCDCSKEKYAQILVTLKTSQLQEMIAKDHGAELTCNFCGNKYNYTEEELKAILADKK